MIGDSVAEAHSRCRVCCIKSRGSSTLQYTASCICRPHSYCLAEVGLPHLAIALIAATRQLGEPVESIRLFRPLGNLELAGLTCVSILEPRHIVARSALVSEPGH